MLKPDELAHLSDNALDAFWAVVVRHFPNLRTGELSPWATVRLDLAARDAIQEWVCNNVPTARLGKEGDHA